LLIDLALCALTALWMLWLYTLHPAWRSRPVIMTVFVIGLLIIVGVLVVREPWFGILAVACYIYSFAVIEWPWQLLALAVGAIVAATAQSSGIAKDTPLGVISYLAIIAVNMGGICGFAWILRSSNEQSRQRKRALDEVSETNRRLEATLAENARLHEQLLARARETGVLDERQRMAREIHDTIAQGLIGIVTQLQAAEQASDDPAEWRRHFEAASSLARESLSEARRSVNALRPESLETARLSDALAGIAEHWSTLNGTTVTVTTTGTVRPMREEAEITLLRTAQEALANVAKHAHAGRVGLTLSYLEREVALDVRDDGSGFEPADTVSTSSTRGGFGLVAMRQRVEGVSGTLQIESEPGGGTAISARIPLEAA
jgi:signal transduction histidine kinase